MNTRSSSDFRWWHLPAMLLLVAVTPIIAAALLIYGLFTAYLYGAMWCLWGARGTSVLFVYSDSPNWKTYIETEILSRLKKGSITLNWSERRRWKRSLATMVFHRFGGSRDFNPIAIVVRPWRPVRVIRFRRAFLALKQGKPNDLKNRESELFAAIARFSTERVHRNPSEDTSCPGTKSK